MVIFERNETLKTALSRSSIQKKKRLEMNPAMHRFGNKDRTEEEKSIFGRPHKNFKTSETGISMGEMAQFGAYLRDADLAHVKLERDRLAFERERMACNREDRIRDRDERGMERL